MTSKGEGHYIVGRLRACLFLSRACFFSFSFLINYHVSFILLLLVIMYHLSYYFNITYKLT